MNNFAVNEMYSEKYTKIPSVSSLLKISLGLILFTMISTVLVYAETMSVDVDGTSFDVEYSAEQVVVNNMITEYEPNDDYAGLILSVDVTGSPGTLELILDRSFMDSIFDGIDDDYFVLVDGIEPNFTETTNTQSRTLNIEVPFGTEDIEIIGTVFGDSTIVVVPDTSEEDAAAKVAADAAAADAAAKAAADAAAKAAADAAAKAAADAAATEDNTLQTQCGPGTILRDGACVLDERCGPGTILKDGACILDTTSQSSSSGKELGSEFAMGMIIAIAIAGAILVILAMIAIFGNQFNKWTK